MLSPRLLNLSNADDTSLLQAAYNWKSQMPPWYQAMAASCPLTWVQFLEERAQPTYANFVILDDLGQPASLIAFSALGNDDYEAHLISRRGVGARELMPAAAHLCNALFTALHARMIVTKTADCNVGMVGMLKWLGFEPTESVHDGGIYRHHVIRVRLWRRGREVTYGR